MLGGSVIRERRGRKAQMGERVQEARASVSFTGNFSRICSTPKGRSRFIVSCKVEKYSSKKKKKKKNQSSDYGRST